MARNGRKPESRGQFLVVRDKAELRRLIDRESRARLGLSGEEALDRIRRGKAGDNYVWTHLSMLAGILQ